MRTAPILTLTAVLVFSAGCARPKTWTPFTTPDGKVTILFPGTPKPQTSNEAGMMTNAYVCEFRNEAYLLSSTDLPPNIKGDMQGAVNGIAGRSNGKVLSQSPIVVNGQSGTAYEMEVKSPVNGFATGRIFQVGNRLYQLMALGTTCRASNPDVVKFLGSLDLSKAK